MRPRTRTIASLAAVAVALTALWVAVLVVSRPASDALPASGPRFGVAPGEAGPFAAAPEIGETAVGAASTAVVRAEPKQLVAFAPPVLEARALAHQRSFPTVSASAPRAEERRAREVQNGVLNERLARHLASLEARVADAQGEERLALEASLSRLRQRWNYRQAAGVRAEERTR